MKFNINDYRGKYAMHCKTAEEAKSFCNYLDKIGKKWIDGERYTEDNGWDKHKDNTCYLFNKGQRRPYHRAFDEGYTILEWSDFMDGKFTKSNLKNGDVILRADGDVEIVCIETGTLIASNGFNYLAELREDLTSIHSDFEDNVDVVAVRRPLEPADCQFCAFKHNFGELVYERKSEPEEMTLEEVCKALGKEIKIVKEH